MIKKILGQLRSDFLQLGWIMAIWAAWILFDSVTSWQRWHDAEGVMGNDLVASFSKFVVPLIGIVFVAILAPSLAFGHSPWRSNAFWRTRPLSTRYLVLTRLSLLFFVIGVIPLAIRIGVLTFCGIEPGLAFSNALVYSLGFLAGVVLWGLAMHFGGWRQLIMAVIALHLLGFLFYQGIARKAVSLLYRRSRGDDDFSRPPHVEIPDGLGDSRYLITLILLTAGTALAGAVLFRWRNRWLGFGVLGLAGTAAFAISMWPVNFFEPKHLGTIHFAFPVRTEGPPVGESDLECDLIWDQDAVPDHHWLGLMEISTDYPLASGTHSTWRFKEIHRPAGMGLSVQRLLVEHGMRAVPGIQSNMFPLDGRARFTAISHRWKRPAPWTVSGEVRAHWFRHEIAGSIPVASGARFLKDGYLIIVDSARFDEKTEQGQQNLTIGLFIDRLVGFMTPNEYWQAGRSGLPFQQWHLALVIPAGEGGEIEPSQYKHLGRIPNPEYFKRGEIIQVPLFNQAKPEGSPLITPETMSKCRLMIFRPVYVETMTAPFEGGADH